MMAIRLAFLSLVVLILGCGSCKESGNETQQIDPILIKLGSGGGFTGQMSGVEVDSTGVVRSWSALPREDVTPEIIGTMPADVLLPLYRIIEEDDLLNFDFKETGNMTTTLTLSRGDKVNIMRWPGIDTDTDVVPEKTMRFMLELAKALKKIDKTTK